MNKMDKMNEQILRASKEIVVKFIEAGRVSPTAFPEVFKKIYQAVDETVKGTQEFSETEEDGNTVDK